MSNFEHVDVKQELVGTRILRTVYNWPEKIKVRKAGQTYFTGISDRDNNIIDFVVDNGRARYYIIHGLEDELWVYAKKFYHITYEVK